MNQKTDARERKLWEFFTPSFLQARSIARGGGEEKFVVFAVGNCVVDLSAWSERKFFFVDLESEFARARESREIGAEAVAQIHHRMDAETFREPARFINARNESQMFAAQRSAKFSRDEKIVGLFPASARDGSAFFNETGNTD